MNLQPRFLLLTAMLFFTAAIPGWFAVRALAEGIVGQWAQRYAEQQVRYDKSRALQPILRDVALARQLAASQPILDWARNPNDPARTARGIAELESYRLNFRDNSYFAALLPSGRYYHNNASNEFAGRAFRYVLDPAMPKDAWFFNLVRERRAVHLNVNGDEALGVTKLWVNVLILDGEEVVGMVGTGMDLAAFLRDVVEPGVPGVVTLFVDHDGAIQLHRNASLIDFSSVSRRKESQKTLKLLFDREEDRESVASAMAELQAGPDRVLIRPVVIDGKRTLAGIAPVPEIGWYEITLLDLDVLLPASQFTGLVLIYVLGMAVLLVAFNLALNRLVVRPLGRLSAAVDHLREGKAHATGAGVEKGSGEFRRLMRQFADMAASVLEARRDLESKVQERTLALDRLTKIDALTELLNRRGMTERLEAELDRASREGTRLGVLWIDIDRFKDINDRHGHAAGDQALKAVAVAIQQAVRKYDVASRWGGDEFLVLTFPNDQENLDRVGERVRAAIGAIQGVAGKGGERVSITASVGGQLALAGMGLETLLRAGDDALYQAKASGRNAYRAITPGSLA